MGSGHSTCGRTPRRCCTSVPCYRPYSLRSPSACADPCCIPPRPPLRCRDTDICCPTRTRDRCRSNHCCQRSQRPCVPCCSPSCARICYRDACAMPICHHPLGARCNFDGTLDCECNDPDYQCYPCTHRACSRGRCRKRNVSVHTYVDYDGRRYPQVPCQAPCAYGPSCDSPEVYYMNCPY